VEQAARVIGESGSGHEIILSHEESGAWLPDLTMCPGGFSLRGP